MSNIGRHGRLTRRDAIGAAITQKLKPSLDMRVGRIQLGGSLVSIEGIVYLVVARFILKQQSAERSQDDKDTRSHPRYGGRKAGQTYQSTKVVPDLRDEGVQANRTGVRVERISVLVDLVVEDTDGTPECRVPPVTIHSLLVSLVRFGIFLLSHVASPKEIPALRIRVICHVLDIALQSCLKPSRHQVGCQTLL